MRIYIAAGLALTASLTFAAQARAEVHLTIRDGRVTLNAAGATVQQILVEWAKIGQTRIVNAERIAGGPLTLQLTNVPEEQALDVILRSVSGYVAAPRAIVNAGASRFDRILIMPPSTPPRVAAAVPQPPSFPQPQFPNQPQMPNDDDDGPRNVVMPNPRGPIFNTFPQQLQQGNPFPQPMQPGVGQVVPTTPQGSAGPPASANPGQAPVGVAVPGMIYQPPQPQPGQPGFPQQGQPGFPLMPGQPPQIPPGL